MPTPSADQTTDDIPPTTSHQFLTCPDDPQHSPRRGGTNTRPDLPLGDLSSAALGIDSPQHMHMSSRRDSNFVDNNYGNVSSRDTTVSPGPSLNTLGIPSSDRSSELPLYLKDRETSPDEPGSFNLAQDRDVEQHGQPTKDFNALEMAVIDVEDGAHNHLLMGSEYPNVRAIPSAPSSYLRPGSRFYGTQQSERQVYEVQVELKNVNMAESFLCGYLRIQGLTEDHPTRS
ncbi:hypothetical protein E4U53_001618 [Claviceps sorghi]|nr:hypothetical protein E4U53_001618 [Claviceps sorghi]